MRIGRANQPMDLITVAMIKAAPLVSAFSKMMRRVSLLPGYAAHYLGHDDPHAANRYRNLEQFDH